MFKIYVVLSIIMLICSVCGVFQVRYQVDSVNKSLNAVYDDINLISEEIEVLDAELSYFATPIRIEKLAESYLKMEPLRVGQVISDIGTGYTVLADENRCVQ